MNPPACLALAYQEAAHLAGFLNRVQRWDKFAVIRLQTRGQVAGVWAESPLGPVCFVAIPLQAVPAEPVDRFVLAGRLRDIIGDLTQLTEANRSHSYPVPDEVAPTPALLDLPPATPWLPGEKMTCGKVADLVEEGVAEYHRQASAHPTANHQLLDQIARDVWRQPALCGMPRSGLHAARQLGFLNHPDARAEFATAGTWRRLITPAGQVFWQQAQRRPKLRVV